MNKRLKSTREKLAAVLRKRDVVKAGVFGSFARGEDSKGSDIDILIKFKGRKSLFDLVRLERELKKTMKRDIDLLTYDSLNPHLKDRILKEEVRIL